MSLFHKTNPVSGVVAQLEKTVKGGETFYYFTLVGDNHRYCASARLAALLLKEGQNISFRYFADETGLLDREGSLRSVAVINQPTRPDQDDINMP